MQRVRLARMLPWRAFFIAAACVPVVAACGSSESGSESDDPGQERASADAVLTEAKAALARGYDGDFQPPPSSGPPAVEGKDVWMISCGQAFEACNVQATAFKDAGEELGWQVTIQDGKADPAVASNIIRQAVAAGVDGIAVAFFDCPKVKGALLDARAAGVPVVTSGSLDCDNRIYEGAEEPLYSAVVNLRGSTDAAAFYEKWAEARANYIIARSNGTANALSIYENSEAIQQANGRAFAKRMEECTGCSVTEVPFTFAQIPNPATLEWKSAIVSNPDATVIANGIDSNMGLGLQSAIQQSGRTDLVVDGGEGQASNIELIQQGAQRSATAMPYEWIFWGLADTLNRVFAGEDPADLPSQGAGWQFIDKEHNLPPAGESYEIPVDFKAAYRRVWTR